MTFYMRNLGILLKSTFIVLAFLISLFIVFRVVLFLLPYEIAIKVEDKVYFQLLGTDYRIRSYHTQEYIREEDMKTDNNQVRSWISRCVCDTKQLMNCEFECKFESSVLSAVENLSPVYYRMCMLNDRLWKNRFGLELSLSDTYRIAHHGTFFIIIIGFLTTAMVGLSSTELGKQTTRIALSIRVAALILPALGTAVVAMTAFYNPSANIVRQLQAVSGLQQLQTEISSSVWKMDCPKKPEEFPVLNDKIDSWTKRLQELLAIAGDTRSQAASPTPVPDVKNTAQDGKQN